VALTRRCGQSVVRTFLLEPTNHCVLDKAVEDNPRNESVGNGKTARACQASKRATGPAQQTHAMAVAEAAMDIEIFIAQVEPALFGKTPYAGFHPRIAPTEKEARQIGQCEGRRREMGDDSRRFDVDRSASIRYVQTKIDVIQKRNQLLVERAEALKNRSVSPGWEGRLSPSAHRNVASETAGIQRFRHAWRKGGGSIWMTPALDPVRSTIYVGIGNPWPTINGDVRPGDNLYTDSVVALDAKTGKMRWYFQEVPHDLWDYDAASPPVLFDAADSSGRRVAAVGQAGKTGWFYVLNRDTGALIRRSQPFVSQRDMFKQPTPQGVFAEPAGGGVVAPVAFDPASHQVFITTLEQRNFARSTDFYWLVGGDSRSGIVAINVDTGTKTWQRWFPSDGRVKGGLNASAGPCSVSDVVFASQWGTALRSARSEERKGFVAVPDDCGLSWTGRASGAAADVARSASASQAQALSGTRASAGLSHSQFTDCVRHQWNRIHCNRRRRILPVR